MWIYTVLSQNLSCHHLRTFYVERNLSQKCCLWRINDKYQVSLFFVILPRFNAKIINMGKTYIIMIKTLAQVAECGEQT